MKSTEQFKQTIQTYLDERAKTDVLFAPKYNNPEKNIDNCITYILNTVQKSGCNGFTDDEIYSMAVHYYDENIIDIGEEIDPRRVVVNHIVKLTEEEKYEARKKAIDNYQADILHEMMKKSAKPENPVKKKKEIVNQPSLFDL